MTYDTQETSQQSGQPVELFDFVFGSSTFNFTSGEDDLSVGGTDYQAVEIRSTAVRISKENRSQSLEITLPANNAFASQFIGVQPGQQAFVTIRRFHRTDGGSPEVIVVFKGTVRAVSFTDNGYLAKLSVLPLNALQRNVPRRTYQYKCNHVLYDSRCQVVEGDFRFVNTVSAVSADGRTLTVPGLDAAKGVGFSSGGFVTIPTLGEFRLILTHQATDQIVIIMPFAVSPVGTSVEVLAGCNHDLDICKSKFDNVINYGGTPFVPLKNPFTAGVTPGSASPVPKTFTGILG